ASSIKKAEETGELYCQRCFRLRHYNEIVDVHITDDEFLKLLHEVGDSDALVVNVVDIFDFNLELTDVAEIDSLNKNARQGKDPDDVSIGDLK
ncbi:MAG: hypothetical protein E6294_10200, partial [Klebsiella sp.]|nr:hypothetical protein [Klebsiella sp.]